MRGGLIDQRMRILQVGDGSPSTQVHLKLFNMVTYDKTLMAQLDLMRLNTVEENYNMSSTSWK